MANRLSVKLDGQEYTIVSEESREYMLEISDEVNRRLADIKIQNNKSNMIGRVNVLTGVISGGVNAICLDQDVLFCGNDHRVYSLDASEPMSPKNLS